MIVQARYQAGRDFKPAIGLMVQMEERLEDRAQLRTGLLNIEGIRKPLEVKIDGLNPLKKGIPGFCGHNPFRGYEKPDAGFKTR
jgi:hypothetical protein